MGAEGTSRRWRCPFGLIIVHLSEAESRSCANPSTAQKCHQAPPAAFIELSSPSWKHTGQVPLMHRVPWATFLQHRNAIKPRRLQLLDEAPLLGSSKLIQHSNKHAQDALVTAAQAAQVQHPLLLAG